MKTKYTIGRISEITGLPAKTIRFYEETGVIDPPRRLENGYRTYDASAIEELKLLKYARDIGLPLSEIKKLMKGCENGDCGHSESYIQKTIENYVVLLEDKIRQMHLLKTRLNGLKKILKTGENDNRDTKYCCDILHQLINYSKKGGD